MNRIWDNGPVHVVSGPNGVIISLSVEAAHKLALILPLKSVAGWRDLVDLRSALDCLLVGDPASVRRANREGFLSTLSANAQGGVPSPRPGSQG